jgi:hypothetical protein
MFCRLALVEAICELTDRHVAGRPPTEEERRAIYEKAFALIEANELLGETAAQLSDFTANALICILIDDVKATHGRPAPTLPAPK